MSWLGDRTLNANYVCPKCNAAIKVPFQAKSPDSHRGQACSNCDIAMVYTSTDSDKMGGSVRETFDQNGRKAIRVRHPDGKVKYRSQTKQDYLDGKGTESKLTPAASEVYEKQQVNYIHSMMTARRAQVRKVR